MTNKKRIKKEHELYEEDIILISKMKETEIGVETEGEERDE